MIKKISQSFIKDMRSYFANDECGNVIREKYINDRFVDDGEPGAMELGSYFEYELTKKLTGTGSLPKNGKTPKPLWMSSKLNEKRKIKGNEKLTDDEIAHMFSFGVDQMYDEYRKVYKNAQAIYDYFQLMGLKVIEAGVRKEKVRFDGTIDLIVECTKEIKFSDGTVWKVGYRFVLDLKYSGLVGGRVQPRNKHGWALVDKDDYKASEIQKEYHGTQAKQYHYLTDLDFYFWVTQSNNDKDNEAIVELFHVLVTEEMVKRHLEVGHDLMRKFKTTAEFGFVAKPELSRCNACPLKGECKDKATFPQPKVVHLTV